LFKSDKQAYGTAIAIRQVTYLNNVVEQNHGAVKHVTEILREATPIYRQWRDRRLAWKANASWGNAPEIPCIGYKILDTLSVYP
jgi:hypothetical protein